MGAMLWRHRPKGVIPPSARQQPCVISWEAHQEALSEQSRTYEAQLTALREAHAKALAELEESLTEPEAGEKPKDAPPAQAEPRKPKGR